MDQFIKELHELMEKHNVKLCSDCDNDPPLALQEALLKHPNPANWYRVDFNRLYAYWFESVVDKSQGFSIYELYKKLNKHRTG